MSHKRPFAAIIAALMLLTSVLGAQEDAMNYDTRMVQMLEGYMNLVSTPLDEGVEDDSRTSWSIVARAINEGFLRFTVDPTTNSLIFGARFSALPGSNVTHIVITEPLLEVWGTNPSLAYTIFAGAVREAGGFFLDPPTWGAAQNDLQESFILRAEAYAAQAELVRDRLEPTGYELSTYETYLLESLETDGIASLTLFLEGLSLPISQNLYDLRLAFEGNSDADALRESLIGMGESLLQARNALPADSPDEAIFPLAVAIHTWLELTPTIISRIHNRGRNSDPLTFGEVLSEEVAYERTRRRLENSRTTDMPLIIYIREETVNGFEALRELR